MQEKKIEDMTEQEIETMINERVYRCKQRQAISMLKYEGSSLSEADYSEMFEIVKKPISTKEAEKQLMLLCAKKYDLDPKLLLDDD